MKISIFSSIKLWNNRLQLWRNKLNEQGWFYSIFEFEHTKLTTPDYEREVLFKLGFIAEQVVISAKQYRKNPDYKSRYDEAFRKYDRALSLVRLYAPEFGARIPHWSLLPNQLDPLIKGEELLLFEDNDDKADEQSEYQPPPTSLFPSS